MRLLVALTKHMKLPTESVTQFSAELKKLTPKDKADFARWFAVEYGYEIEDQVPMAEAAD